MIIDPQSTSSERLSHISPRRDSALAMMSARELAEHCKQEMSHYRCGDSSSGQYSLELLRRATKHDDQEARAWMQHCFSGLVHSWLHRHLGKNAECHLESEENYIAQAFERFWQATVLTQRVEFNTLAAVLQYLRASLNGAILDTLRSHAQPKETLLLDPGEPGEPHVEDATKSSEVWETLQTMLADGPEQRLAYLLFHCGLKPQEIVHFYPQEWNDVQEIYHLRCSIMERLLRNADYLHPRPGMSRATE